MGFYIRKSITVGPLRFNLSKSGIGVSVGTTGFRVGTGPRGNYVHLGREGIYYRATIPEALRDARRFVDRLDGEIDNPANAPEDASAADIQYSEEFESGDIIAMRDSSSEELLEEIERKHKKLAHWPLVAALTLFACALSIFFLPLCPVALIAGIAATLIAYRRDKMEKSVVIMYDLEGPPEAAYEALHTAYRELSASSRAWHVHARHRPVEDSKTNLSAAEIYDRQPISLISQQPPFIETNIAVPTIPVGKQTLYFLPDNLLIIEGSQVGAVSYSDLQIEAQNVTVLEDEPKPPDAEVHGTFYRYVNKDGTPDARFKANPQYPQVTYSQIHLRSSSGINEVIHLSRANLGQSLIDAVAQLAQAAKLAG